MGLSEALARAATRRVHVLVAEVPGAFTTRVALEREVTARGWVLAASPAEADVLAVCGPSVGSLAEQLAEVFDQLPGPRARVDVGEPEQVSPSLDAARDRLRDGAAQVDDARHRVPADRPPADDDDADDADDDMDHGDMGHGDMEMAPAGIPLAEGADDRDGLEMDVLHLPLGPVLPHWPAGLVVRTVLHGDVVADVEVDQAGGAPTPVPTDPAHEAARRVDAGVSVLALAGWERGAAAARHARDLCLAGDPAAGATLARLRGRLARARLLRWMLRGLGTIDAGAVPAELRDSLAGDVHDRLLRLVDDAVRAYAGTTSAAAPYDARHLLPDLLAGLELASVRLVVAGLAPYLLPVQEAAHA